MGGGVGAGGGSAQDPQGTAGLRCEDDGGGGFYDAGFFGGY